MKKVFLILAIFFFATEVSAANVFISPTEGEGVEPHMKATIDSLVKSFVSKESNQISSTADAADFTLSPKLIRLGNAYFITIDKTKDGRILYTSNMKAAVPEDLDVTAKRVVRSVLTEVKIEDSATVKDVTIQEETQNTRRYQATRQWRFLFGPTAGSNLNGDSNSFFNFGYAWGMDPNYDATVDWKVASVANGGSYSSLMLAMTYYMDIGKHTPYFRAGIGRASGAAGDNTAFIFSDDSFSGWGAQIGAGYKFFRTSSVNVVVEATYDQAFTQTSETKKTPGLMTVGVGMYY